MNVMTNIFSNIKEDRRLSSVTASLSTLIVFIEQAPGQCLKLGGLIIKKQTCLKKSCQDCQAFINTLNFDIFLLQSQSRGGQEI